jgi:hypothetical protein
MPTIQIVKVARRLWRWRVVNDSDEVVANGGDVFGSRDEAWEAAERMQVHVRRATIIDGTTIELDPSDVKEDD